MIPGEYVLADEPVLCNEGRDVVEVEVVNTGALSVPGLALRVLGCSTDEVSRLILAVVDDLRARWAGQPALNLRKY